MTQFAADETEEDEVASALEPSAAESSDSKHLARALLLQGEAERMGEAVRYRRKENHAVLPL
jgi:hypothetical protein